MSSAAGDQVGGQEHHRSLFAQWSTDSRASTVPRWVPPPPFILRPTLEDIIGPLLLPEPPDDDDRTLSDWSEGYPSLPEENEDSAAPPSDTHTLPDPTSLEPFSYNMNLPEMFGTDHNSPAPSLHDVDGDAEPPVDPALFDNYLLDASCYHDPEKPYPQDPSPSDGVVHEPVIDANSEIAATQLDVALPDNDMESPPPTDLVIPVPVIVVTVPEEPVGIVDFIHWVAKESKSRFLLGFKIDWTWAECQEVIGKAYQSREACITAGISLPSQEEALAAQAKEFEDAPLERKRNLARLSEYWGQFHAESIQYLSILLRENGATAQDIQSCVDAGGNQDVYQLIGKLWHIQNPTPGVKKFKIHLGRISAINGKLEMMPLELDWDMDFAEFWGTLEDYAPHPEYLPKGDPDDGEFYEYDYGDLSVLDDNDDKEDTEPIIDPIEYGEEDTQMPEAISEAHQTVPKLTWTYRVMGEAQVGDFLDRLEGEIAAGPHGADYGRVVEIRNKGDYEFMRTEMRNPATPHVILFQQTYYELHRRDRARKAAFAAKRARESGDVEGEDEWWVQK